MPAWAPAPRVGLLFGQDASFCSNKQDAVAPQLECITLPRLRCLSCLTGTQIPRPGYRLQLPGAPGWGLNLPRCPPNLMRAPTLASAVFCPNAFPLHSDSNAVLDSFFILCGPPNPDLCCPPTSSLCLHSWVSTPHLIGLPSSHLDLYSIYHPTYGTGYEWANVHSNFKPKGSVMGHCPAS